MVVNISNSDNPFTSVGSVALIFIASLIVSGLIYYLLSRLKINKYMVIVLLIGVIVLIPYTVYALCKCEIKIDSKIEIVKPFTGTIYRNYNEYIKTGESIVAYEAEKWCYGIKGNGIEGDYCYPMYFDTKEQCENESGPSVKSVNPNNVAGVSMGPSYSCFQTKAHFGLTVYTQDASTIDKGFYLKHDVEDNIIKKSYACVVANGEEYCTENGADKYESNKTVLGGLPTPWSCGISIYNNEEYGYICDGETELKDYADIYGGIETGYSCGLICFVSEEGHSSCTLDECED